MSTFFLTALAALSKGGKNIKIYDIVTGKVTSIVKVDQSKPWEDFKVSFDVVKIKLENILNNIIFIPRP